MSPYTSVTGARNEDDVRMIDRALADGTDRSPGTVSDFRGPADFRTPVCGVLVSGKTMRGEPGGSSRYPRISTVADMMGVPSSAELWLHFNTRVADPVDEQVLELFGRLGGYGAGLQLNTPRLEVPVVRRIRDAYADMEIAMQVGEECVPGLAPHAVNAYVSRFAGVIDHVLLDLSRGSGKALDVEWVTAVVRLCAEEWMELGIRPTLAGGLGPHSGPVLSELARRLGSLLVECSFDAETNVISDLGRNDDLGDDFWTAARFPSLDEARVRGYWRAVRDACVEAGAAGKVGV